MKFFIALGSLLVLGLLALLVAPRFVDWTAYRSGFEAEASRMLGQKVVVNGRASVRLLPFPSVTFGDVVVGDDPADPVLTMREFGMDAELAPYLSGEIRIFDMRIDSPRLTVPVGADGTVRWPVAAGAAPPRAAVVLEKIEVSNGMATLEDRRSGRRLTFTDVDADISANSLRGPFNGAGTLFANGEPLRFTLSSGVRTAEGALPVRLTAESDRADVAVAIEAVASAAAGQPLLDGKLTVTSPLAEQAATSGPPRAKGLLPKLALESGLRLTSDTVDATAIRAAVGEGTTPYVATGEASLDWGAIPHFDVRLEGQEIDVDTVAPPMGGAETAPSVAARVEGIRTALARIPNLDIPGRLSLSLPLMTIGDTTVREVRFAGSPSETGWSIERLAAELPGRTLVEASGIATVRGEPGFSGSLLVAARQPAAFLRWAGGAVDPTLARLDRAGFSATVDLTADTQAFRDLELDLGGQALHGSILRTLRPEDRVTSIDLRGDTVELDPFVSLARALLPDPAAATTDERLDVQFEANPFRYDGFAATHLEADFTLADGLLDISGVDAADFAGADVHLEGTVADIWRTPRPDLSLDIASERPERFIDFVQTKLPGSPLVASLRRTAQSLGPLSLRGTASSGAAGGSTSLAVDLAGSADGTALGVRLAVENGLAAAAIDGRYGLDLTLSNDRPSVLLDQFGLTALPIDLPAPLAVSLRASGAPGEATLLTLTADAPGSSISARGRAVLAEAGLASFAGRLEARAADASPWLTALAVAAGQDISALPISAAGDLSWSPGRWSLQGLGGIVADTTIAADLAAAAGGSVTGAVRLSDLSSRWVASVLAGVEEDASGSAPTFRSGLLPVRPVQIALSADRFDAWGEEIADLRADLASEGPTLRIANLEGRIGGGRISGSGEVRNVAGFLTIAADATIGDPPLSLAGVPPLLAGTLGGSVRLRGGGQTVPQLRDSLDGTGSIKLTDGVLRGVRLDLLAPVLAAADTDGFRLDDAAVSELASRLSQDATLALDPLTLPFTVSAGTLRTAPFEIVRDAVRFGGSVEVELADRRLAGSLRLAFDRPPGDETVDAPDPAIVYAVAGTTGAPELVASTEPLSGYLAARAYGREQARVQALEEDLRETVRLRREVRLYRERAATRQALRLERTAREEAAAREAAEREAAVQAQEAAAQAERDRAAAAAQRGTAQRAAEEARAAEDAARAIMRRTLPVDRAPAAAPAVGGAPDGARTGAIDFGGEARRLPTPPAPRDGFSGLPGVIDPNAF